MKGFLIMATEVEGPQILKTANSAASSIERFRVESSGQDMYTGCCIIVELLDEAMR